MAQRMLLEQKTPGNGCAAPKTLFFQTLAKEPE